MIRRASLSEPAAAAAHARGCWAADLLLTREEPMTESEWLSCNNARTMLGALHGNRHPSDRKAKLFVVAVCRRIWHLLPNDRSRRAVEIAERYADGEATPKELSAAQAGIGNIRCYMAQTNSGTAAALAARYAAGVQRYYSTLQAVSCAQWAVQKHAGSPSAAAVQEEAAAQVDLLRDVLGPAPFQPLPVLSPALLCWEDGCIVRLATSLYRERDFSPERMGVLADGLEVAGCTDRAILEHLRGGGPHARGCWPVDLALGRD
jgi:hypothetical protein